MKLMIINGSVREGRFSDTIQNWAVGILKQDTDLELDVVDLKEVDLPFFNEAASPESVKGGVVSPKGKAWGERIRDAEAFILLTAEYNHGPTAVLKNALDWAFYEWQNKPVGFISYGGQVGGTRAVQQLKQIVIHLRMFPAGANIAIPFARSAFDENGLPINDSLNESLLKLVAELKDLQPRLVSKQV